MCTSLERILNLHANGSGELGYFRFWVELFGGWTLRQMNI